MKSLVRRFAVTMLAAVGLTIAPLGVAQADPGPAFTIPLQQRLAALHCFGDLKEAPRGAVLLVHGTTVTGPENWEHTYRPALLRRGFGVCEVTMPGYAFGDMQNSVQYVATAISETAKRSGKKISIIGHSQGGTQPLFALRVWPELRTHVNDFIGLAGVYDNGSRQIAQDCARPRGCSTSFRQMSTGSNLLTALSKRQLPAGPSYTAIGTLADETVTPQPRANRLPKTTAKKSEVHIQDVCPGRSLPQYNHVFMAGDAVAFALALDALNHPGPAKASRIDRNVCSQLIFGDVNVVGFAPIAPEMFSRRQPGGAPEPAVRLGLL